MYMSTLSYTNLFSAEDLSYVLSLPEVLQAKHDLPSKKTVNFTIPVSESIRYVLRKRLGIDLSTQFNIPMQWIVGDTPSHVDRGQAPFQTTHLVYLTTSPGELRIGEATYPIQSNRAYVFQEGTIHSTHNTEGQPRLLLGPMSERGERVGAAGIHVYYYTNATDASNKTNQLASGANPTSVILQTQTIRDISIDAWISSTDGSLFVTGDPITESTAGLINVIDLVNGNKQYLYLYPQPQVIVNYYDSLSKATSAFTLQSITDPSAIYTSSSVAPGTIGSHTIEGFSVTAWSSAASRLDTFASSDSVPTTAPGLIIVDTIFYVLYLYPTSLHLIILNYYATYALANAAYRSQTLSDGTAAFTSTNSDSATVATHTIGGTSVTSWYSSTELLRFVVYVSGDTITNASTNILNVDGLHYVLYLYPEPVTVGCVLQGTLVSTPLGSIPIEHLQIGDSVCNEHGDNVQIVHVEHSQIFYTDCPSQSCLSKQVYRVPSGLNGTTQDLFLTRNHQIVLENGSLCIPEHCGAHKAPPEEHGWLDVYHLRLKTDSHFRANGCLVTSLSSSKKVEDAMYRPTTMQSEEIPKECQNPLCRGSIRNIS